MAERESELVGVVLAGGKSRRFGRDKLREPWREGWLIDQPIRALSMLTGADVFVVGTADPHLVSRARGAIADAAVGDGPARGVLGALRELDRDIFVLAGDLPNIRADDLELIRAAGSAHPAALVVRAANQPCIAIYRRELATRLFERLEAGTNSLHDLARGAELVEVELPNRVVINANTESELRAAEADGHIPGLFDFESMGPALDLLPLAARRALDEARAHLSLEGWQSLSFADRRSLVLCGIPDRVDTDLVAQLIASSSIAPRAIDSIESKPRPDDLDESLWNRCSALERFALAHEFAKSEQRGDPARWDRARTSILSRLTEANRARIRDVELSLSEAVSAISHSSAGGIATFLGVVRDHNEGQPVTLLEYEAYKPMCELELARIEGEIRAAIPGARVFASHRVGPLRIGDIAVICAASAPHRGEAFEACRRLIDEIKARLPIWKREHGPDGPYWVGWQDARCVHESSESGPHSHRDGHSHSESHRDGHPH